MQLKSVVLPAPFGPMSPTICPWSTSKWTPSSAVIPPNRTCTPLQLSICSPASEEAGVADARADEATDRRAVRGLDVLVVLQVDESVLFHADSERETESLGGLLRIDLGERQPGRRDVALPHRRDVVRGAEHERGRQVGHQMRLEARRQALLQRHHGLSRARPEVRVVGIKGE